MKQTIKVKVVVDGCAPTIREDGDWIDLRSAIPVELNGPTAEMLKKHKGVRYRKLEFPYLNIPLGVAMKLPDGMEAVVALRSSSNKKFHILQVNAPGVIDQPYCGPDDVWGLPILATGEVHINQFDRICQFKIQPSQKATVWQKLKWLFSSGVKIELVDDLDYPNREGFGHSGVN
jgi:dUTP pyrophosphatase